MRHTHVLPELPTSKMNTNTSWAVIHVIFTCYLS